MISFSRYRLELYRFFNDYLGMPRREVWKHLLPTIKMAQDLAEFSDQPTERLRLYPGSNGSRLTDASNASTE